MKQTVRRGFCKKFLGALTRCLRQQLFGASTSDPVCRKTRFDLDKTLRTSFSSLASGKPKITTLAAVRSGRRPSRSDAKRKRSALDSHSEREITKIRICERSELRIKNDDFRAKRVRVTFVPKNFLFSKIHPQEKVVLRVLILVLISFRKLSAIVFCGVEGCFGP